jgi:LysR family glycine cleavage system transcriptional activator
VPDKEAESPFLFSFSNVSNRDQIENTAVANDLPNLRSLQAFEAVGRRGSISAAAVDLGVSPGAISQHIGSLELEVGVSLFERKGRSLALTSWGDIYFQRVRAGFDHLRTAQESLQRARLKSGIVLSAPPSIAVRWLRQHLTEWLRLCPGVNVRLVGEDDEPAFGEREVDFRISFGTARHRYAHYVDLFHDWVAPVCSPGFLADHPVSGPEDVLRGSLIGIEWQSPQQASPSWSNWASHFGVKAPERPCELSFSLSTVGIDAALNGDGFVLAQYSMVADELAQGRLVAACGDRVRLPEPYALAWDPASLDRPHVKEFRDFMVKAGRSLKVGSAAGP